MNTKAFVFALLTALVWGTAPAIEKMGLRGNIDPYVGVVVRTIPIIIFSFLGLVLMGRLGALSEIDPKSAVFLCLGGLIAGFVGQFTLYSALKAGEASMVVPISATFPLVTLFIAYFFLGETITISKAVGIVLVIGGVFLLR